MPSFRGVTVALATKDEGDVIPEYPHPEGASVRLRSYQEADGRSGSSMSSFSTPDVVDLSQLSKMKPTTSVYVPSVTGSTFSVVYDVKNTPSAPCKYLFFRLFMNGRSITAWGIDPLKKARGTVTRSFWEPGERFHDAGIEGRNFLFMPGQENKSVAEEGGLIEIQLFRAKERKSRAPTLDQYRAQDKYSILAPSIGLVDRPQDLYFYEWHLMDAKDAPFASFRFHYRSWTNLKDLNLVPASELEIIRSASVSSMSQVSYESRGQADPHRASEGSFSFNLDGSPDDTIQVSESQSQGEIRLGFIPTLRPKDSFTGRLPQPGKATRDAYSQAYLQRPLPELPKDENSPPRTSRPSSMVSVVSAAPSLTPSLVQYVDDGSFDLDFTQTGIATVVPIQRTDPEIIFRSDPQGRQPAFPSRSSSLYDYSRSSLDSTAHLTAHAAPVPTIDEEEEFPGRDGLGYGQQVYGSVSDLDQRKGSMLTLSESEWMRKTPSPVREREETVAERAWSPRPKRKSGKSFLASLRNRGKKGPKNDMGKMDDAARRSSSVSLAEEDDKSENWI